LRSAFARIKALLQRPDVTQLREESSRFIQAEGYIDGLEYAVEGLVSGGRLRVLAIFDKPDPLDGPFFEETLYVTPSRASVERQSAIAEAMQNAVTALGLTDGPLHAEARANADGVWVLEVAPRPIGGLCARALRFNEGVPLEEVLLRHAVGEAIGPLTLDGPAAGVMMIPIPASGAYSGVSGTDGALAVPGIEDIEITAKSGQALLQLPEGSSYLGFLFARGPTSACVEQALRSAHSKLEFRITPLLPVV